LKSEYIKVSSKEEALFTAAMYTSQKPFMRATRSLLTVLKSPVANRPPRSPCPVVPSSRSRSVQLLQLAVFSLLLGSLLTLLDLVKVLHELRNLVILVCLLLAGLTSSGGLTSRKGGVGLGELAQGSEGVWAELVEDSGNELGQVFVGSVAVDGEGVGARGGVDCEGGWWGAESVGLVVVTKSRELATAEA
jgi:hypothetical protein